MKIPSLLEAAHGAFSIPSLVRLREIGLSGLPIPEKRKQAYPAVIEFRASLDNMLSSKMFHTVYSAARLANKNLPRPETWIDNWSLVKQKMKADPKYVGRLCDALPEIAARYSPANAVGIFGDKTLISLIEDAKR